MSSGARLQFFGRMRKWSLIVKMRIHRPVVVVVTMLVILVNTMILPIHAEGATPLKLQDFSPSTMVSSKQHDDKDASDHRQGRTLQAELPSLKAKREQTLRNILAVRRRQALNKRPTPAMRIWSNHTLRPPDLSTAKGDTSDMLEAQETRQGAYATAPSDSRTDVAEKEPDDSQIQEKLIAEAKSEGKNDAKEEESSKLSDSKLMEQSLIGLEPNTTNSLTNANKSNTNTTRINAINQKNLSSTPASIVPSVQKTVETEIRKKNTVVMPVSLYNHFQPVESNIPVEDMTQFLYFGQKLHPEVQNTTSNNSVDASSTVSSSMLNSRRRYSSKRYSPTATTTKITTTKTSGSAILGLEEIMNEEMNIAVERQTVEKNRVSKIKNIFRSPGTSIYYRKPKPTDSTIASNVILSETTRNSSSSVKSETESREEKPRVFNQSAHASVEEQQLLNRDGGSAAHVTTTDVARNSSEMTQIPVTGATSSNTNFSKDSNQTTSTSSEKLEKAETAKPSREAYQRSKKNDDSSPSVDSNSQKKMDSAPGVISTRGLISSRESNNIESSMSREKSLQDFATRVTSVEETSTLRIVVTEGNIEHDFAMELASRERNTVKPMDYKEESPRIVSLKDFKGKSSLSEDGSGGQGSREYTEEGEEVEDEEEGDEEEHQQQQHVYAYTITNVTRLLRNYTGPGLSKEEQEGGPRSTGAREITTEAPLSSELPSVAAGAGAAAAAAVGDGDDVAVGIGSGVGSAGGAGKAGIEAERPPAKLSTGTTVQPDAAAAGVAELNLVGERHAKVATVEPHSQRAIGRATTSTILSSASNRTVSTRSRQEVTTRGSIRWNHSKSKSFELDGVTERRLLRKSASAVLNQRSGLSVDEESGGKRRRIPSSLRRIKEQILFRNEDRFSNGSTSLNETANSERNSVSDRRTVNESVSAQVNKPVVIGASQTELSGNFNNSSMVRNTNVVEQTANGTELPSIYDTTVKQMERKVDTKDDDSRELTPLEETDSSNGVSTESAMNAVVHSSDLTVTEAVATDSPEERAGTTMTAATPSTIKSMTSTSSLPKIMTESSEETLTSNPTRETPNQPTVTKSPEENRPFGMSEDLDPSEIQKLYRSKDTAKTESPMVTTSGTTKLTTKDGKQRPTVDTRTPPEVAEKGDSERSPEVRGRNLSDETKDKDDVLPIMQLYNTSEIFNGSKSTEGKPNMVGDPRVELPVEEDESEASGTSTGAGTVNPAGKKSTSTSDTSSTSRLPSLPEAKEPVKKDKHVDREESISASTPPRSYNVSSGSSVNRTRHRTPYHHAILPEFNNSVYPSEMNRTFFDSGMIAVSPRESVNISEVISKRHDGDTIASQETVAVVSYILATLVVFPIAVGVGLILRRLILRNRKVLEESDTSSEISCRKDALNLENGDFKTSIEKAITKLPRIQHLCHEAEKPPPPPAQESRWEFPRDKLRLQTVLGQGNFGQVWKAEADDLTGHQGTTRLVAVKTVKEGAADREKEDLVRELEIMQQLGSHPNVVTLLGCCTEEEPHYLILEYVMYGKLLAYLRDHRTRQDFYNFSEDSAALTSRDLTVFGYCVARGMEYLASKKIIHRDLAARNVLVDHNKLCKIADFGMSRFANSDGEVIETRHGRNALPIRWMAPESLMYSLFTTKTDVWSFGILMWEIVTLGSTPYPDMTAREVMRNVQSGYRLERPSHCRSELFRVIARCWHADPDRRPEFQTLRRDLAQLLEDNMNGHYVDLESFASECTD
ncbi:uncharacterized protein [Prorops nasuta]|uniref:uncharacterized protein n=1 Tax=Prorops nasuta TaxID=863751 RepID=UPI0034D01A3B